MEVNVDDVIEIEEDVSSTEMKETFASQRNCEASTPVQDRDPPFNLMSGAEMVSTSVSGEMVTLVS